MKVVSGLSPSDLEENPLLDFKYTVSSKTGEINEDRKKAEYKHLKFEIVNDKYIHISGSLHKYKKGDNYSDFTQTELIQAIEDLKEEFKINPDYCQLENVEFGVNIRESWITPELVFKSLILHKGKPFSEMRNNINEAIGRQCYHWQYGIKIYDKGFQCKLDEEVLRFEVKATKMDLIKTEKKEIIYLSDLIAQHKLKFLSQKLFDAARCIMFDDPTINPQKIERLTKAGQALLIDGRNPRFWEGLMGDPKKRCTYDYKRKTFLNIINKNSTRDLNVEFPKEVRNKFLSLMA